MQPTLAVVCDICRGVTDDHYTVGDRIICGGCWDPFGTLEQASEPACETPIDRSLVVCLEHI